MTSPAVQQPLPVAEPSEWWRPRGSDVAHAFRTTGSLSNWFRSECKRARYTAGVEAEAPETVRCSECSVIVDGLTESEARLLDGNR